MITREISAGIVIFRRTDDGPVYRRGSVKFLLLYHGKKYWNFPKGKIEAEEKSLEAAIRETREETGLTRGDLILANNFKVYEKYTFWRGQEAERQKIFKIVIYYLAETKHHQIKISEEHDGYGWFTYREAAAMLKKYKDSARVLNQAVDFIKKSERTV